ncbi:loganic acid O-methyltransferase-like [Rosa rugosa]|uniref:loganic acid O-methyltransferase-like n=1 Tax=Rosa rugosa TaxID=74645 RepID=UPI002B403AD8|nr:loganic acid O-methyltransferase-like [Rosa rugosa]
MAAEKISKLSEEGEAYPMIGGDGSKSYANNSTYQRGAVDVVKQIIKMAAAENLDIEKIMLSNPNNTFNIADLGCSVGPNTFSSVENIFEAVQSKYQSQVPRLSASQIPDFQVFFNDHTCNDFNMLFRSLPDQNRQRYYAAGVPGSFYGRLFPRASIHFVYSSYALQWISRVPKEVMDKDSPAWNKGRIHYLNSTDEVVRAYQAQHAEDMECFLDARAQEIVCGGLMVLIIPGHQLQGSSNDSHSFLNVTYRLLGSSLTDMARKGVVSEDKADSFNIPIYHMSPQELEAVVEKNGCFSIESVDHLPQIPKLDTVTKNAQLIASHSRAVTEELFKQHFGDELVLDELFDLYRKKLEEQPSIFDSMGTTTFLAVLKRKAN